jgi:hypothetical protein
MTKTSNSQPHADFITEFQNLDGNFHFGIYLFLPPVETPFGAEA